MLVTWLQDPQALLRGLGLAARGSDKCRTDGGALAGSSDRSGRFWGGRGPAQN